MVLPTSMTPSGPESFSRASTSANFDSTQSFKLFLDIVTPPEFSKLLRARVKHLLKTWPPQSASTIAATSSSSAAPSNEYSPSFETVRAFAAFFRTHDSPGPSPIDLSAPTSLQALHHHLLALQTLLSFLSARELQDIVRARLTENGRDRSVAVQGLMDIMRNPGGDDMLEQLVSGSHAVHLVRDSSSNKDEGESREVDQPLMPIGQVTPSSIIDSKHKAPVTSCNVMELADEGEVSSPPSKLKRGEDSTADELELSPQTPVDVSSVLTQPPLPAIPPSDAEAPASTATTPSAVTMEKTDSSRAQCDLASEEQSLPRVEINIPPTSEVNATSESQEICDARPEISEVESLAEVGRDTSEGESRASTNVVQNSDEEDEGLVVTLIEEDTAQQGLQAISSPPEESLPAAPVEPVSSDPVPALSPIPPSLPTSNTRSGEEKPTPPVPFDADLEIGPGPGVSRAEWNRKRFRAALGLPPKEPEKPVEDNVDIDTMINAGPAGQEENCHNLDNTSPGLVPNTNENVNIDSSAAIPNLAVSSSHGASFGSVHTHTPGASPCLGYPTSRTPTPSLSDSDHDDRGSPPGPVLRAVDWATRAVPASLSSDMDVDELDEQDVMEEALVLGHGGSYSLGMSTEGSVKPSSAFSKGFSYQHTPMGGWHNPNAVDGPMWGEVDEKPFSMGSEIDRDADPTQSHSATGTESRRKLFIRLPARGSKGGDTGMVSAGTDVSASASVSASPTPPTPYGIPRSSEKGGMDYDQLMERGKHDEQPHNMQGLKMQSPMTSRPSSGSLGNASSGSSMDILSRPPSHGLSHISSTSHTPPNLIPGAIPHGQHIPHHGPHSQAYPPPPHPHAHPHAHHGYPGPWFGAMFYVPFGGAPHVHTPHPHGHTQPHPTQPPPHSAHHHHHHHHHHPPPQPPPPPSHMLASGMSPSHPSPPHAQSSPTPGPSKPTLDIPRSPLAATSESAPPPAPPPHSPSPDPDPVLTSTSASAPAPPTASGSKASTPPVAPPEGPKRYFKRKGPGEAEEPPSTGEAPPEDPDVRYTDEVGVKESALLKRLCFNCRAVQAPSWRKSKLNVGKILCNKCGIYESTHMTARPLKTRPRRSNTDGAPPPKKRKYAKKPPPPPIPKIP